MTPLEAAARALFDLEGWREHWIEQDLLQVERYKAKARAALTAAVNALPEGGTVNQGSVSIRYDSQAVVWVNRTALLRALVGETSVSGNEE